MHRQSLAAVQRLNEGRGNGATDATDASLRLAAGLTFAARLRGLERIDHAVLSEDGAYAFAVEGALNSPLKRYARVETGAATGMTVGDTFRQLDALHAVQARHATEAPRQPTAELAPEPQVPAEPARLHTRDEDRRRRAAGGCRGRECV